MSRAPSIFRGHLLLKTHCRRHSRSESFHNRVAGPRPYHSLRIGSIDNYALRETQVPRFRKQFRRLMLSTGEHEASVFSAVRTVIQTA
jgi:hypothetical protein